MMRRPRTVSGAGFSAFRETQKPRLSRGFCNKKRGEEKMKKMKKKANLYHRAGLDSPWFL